MKDPKRFRTREDALMHIAACPPLRRELMWLRAMQRRDHAALAYLDEVDPGAAHRVRAFFEASAPELLREGDEAGGGEAFGRLFDQLLEIWVVSYLDEGA
jgi:hypothetical protein